MGRELKRVPLDFAWPQKMIWKGFVCPYHSQACTACGQTGKNPETSQLAETWYGAGRSDPARWCYALTQDEVDALVEHHRLLALTHRFIPGKGWQEKEPPHHPTAAEANAWAQRGLGHYPVNRWICIETRAKRLGVWGQCAVCDGKGEVWFSDEIKVLAETWTPVEPPVGPGWQCWETTSEGSPISPVFETPEALAHWLADTQASAMGDETATYEEWLLFCQSGCPSMVVGPGGVQSGVAAMVDLKS